MPANDETKAAARKIVLKNRDPLRTCWFFLWAQYKLVVLGRFGVVRKMSREAELNNPDRRASTRALRIADLLNRHGYCGGRAAVGIGCIKRVGGGLGW
jgi:hypothetical protein